MSAAPIIIIAPGLWRRRVEVSVEPPRHGIELRAFATHRDARAHAAELAAVHGWVVRDDAQDVDK